jgi:hypothetical protein
MFRSSTSVKQIARSLAIALICCGALVAITQSAAFAVEADDPRQWLVENSDTVLGNEEYQLHSMRRRTLHFSSQLGFERGKKWEWGWTGHSGGHFVFQRHDRNDRRPVSDTEVVAIYNTLAKKYLVQERSSAGVSVSFSSKPSFEWMVHKLQGPNFALYNVNEGAYLGLRGDDHVGYLRK